jgi:hypothetical protein
MGVGASKTKIDVKSVVGSERLMSVGVGLSETVNSQNDVAWESVSRPTQVRGYGRDTGVI